MSKISVVIPIYNKEKQILRSINSVLKQTYKDFRLILVNDGSTDSSRDVIRNNIDDPRVDYYEHLNKGVSYTRNRGIELAETPYISFLDADDEYHPLYLEKMLDSIENSNVCYCGYYYKNSKSIKKAKMNFLKGDILEKYLYNSCSPHTNCWLIKKEFLDQYNIRFSEKLNWGEDMEFFSKILMHDTNVKYVNDYLTFYYTEIEAALSGNNLNKIEKDILWMRKLKSHIASNESSVTRKKNINKAIDTYRLPASIIYRINLNLDTINKNELENIMKYNKPHLKGLRFSNGLRSLKLMMYYLKLKYYSIGDKN